MSTVRRLKAPGPLLVQPGPDAVGYSLEVVTEPGSGRAFPEPIPQLPPRAAVFQQPLCCLTAALPVLLSALLGTSCFTGTRSIEEQEILPCVEATRVDPSCIPPLGSDISSSLVDDENLAGVEFEQKENLKAQRHSLLGFTKYLRTFVPFHFHRYDSKRTFERLVRPESVILCGCKFLSGA